MGTATKTELLPLFDYGSLDVESRIVVQQKTGEIRERVRRAAQDIVEIGQRLIEVKDRLGHGKFGAWLEAEFDWSEPTALRFMHVASHFKSVNLTDLAVAPSALYMLSAPSVPEEARHEAVEAATNGRHVGPAEAKEIIAKHVPAVPKAPRGPSQSATVSETRHDLRDEEPDYENQSQEDEEEEDDIEEEDESEEDEADDLEEDEEEEPEPAPKTKQSRPSKGPVLVLGNSPAFPPKEGEIRPWAGWESIIGDLYGVHQFVREQGGIEGAVHGWGSLDKQRLAKRLEAVMAELNGNMDRWIPWLRSEV